MTRALFTTAPDASSAPIDVTTVACAVRLLEAAETVLARWERGDLAAAIRDLDAASAALRTRHFASAPPGTTAPGTPNRFTPTDGDRP
jgi:hypothetical protein